MRLFEMLPFYQVKSKLKDLDLGNTLNLVCHSPPTQPGNFYQALIDFTLLLYDCTKLVTLIFFSFFNA